MVAETQGIGWTLLFREPGTPACTSVAYKRDAKKPMLEAADQLADLLEAVARRDRNAFEAVYLAHGSFFCAASDSYWPIWAIVRAYISAFF